MPNCKHSLSNTPKHVIMHTRHSKHQDAPKQMFNNKVTRTRALKTTMKQQRTQHIWIHHALAMQLGSRFTLRLYKLDRPPTVADRPPTARTCPISDFWSNFACFGFKAGFLKTFLNDSAWFCLEKLKKHGFEIKNHKN